MRLIPIYNWNKSVVSFEHSARKFSQKPWAQGLILLICVVIAMLLANLPFTKELYREFLEMGMAIHLFGVDGDTILVFPRGMTVEKFINDILMVVFFFTVGLEIKREISYGELSSFKKAILPVIAAFGGVVCPALIYTIVNHGTAAASGWGIPTATDIAFAVCILSVLSDKVPLSLKIFLTALAIADDLVAILVVAFFYGSSINLPLLAISLPVIAFIMLLRKLGENHMVVYLALAFVVWVLFYYSGVHATMSGVVMAFLIPSQPRYGWARYCRVRALIDRKIDEYADVESCTGFPTGPQRYYMREMHKLSLGTMSMSQQVEHFLSPWVNFLIMPLFALANAGVEISGISFGNILSVEPSLGGVGLGIFLGLVLGKPIGITLTSFLAIRFHIGEMPENSNWKMFFAVACLGGIGFTMSIFVDTLSFADQTPEVMMQLRNIGKVAVLMASVCSGIVGSLMITLFASRSKS